jgi:hypothetical protein
MHPPCRGRTACPGDQPGLLGALARAVLPPGGLPAFQGGCETRLDEGLPDTMDAGQTGLHGCSHCRVRPGAAFSMDIGFQENPRPRQDRCRPTPRGTQRRQLRAFCRGEVYNILDHGGSPPVVPERRTVLRKLVNSALFGH